jgi:CRP-like cAMP-binding protein
MIEIIRDSVMFSGFQDDEVKHMDEMLHKVNLKPGQALFQQGQPFKCFYYVNSGIIKLSRLSEDGAEKVIEIIRPGQFFAEALVFMKQAQYPVLATAMKSTELVAIDATKYAGMLHNSVESCFKLLGSMSQRMHQLINEIDALTLHSTKSRLASYLIKSLDRMPSSCIDLELPKGVIASRLSMKPETFSRALHRLHESGIITVDKKCIQVNDETRLREIARQEE